MRSIKRIARRGRRRDEEQAPMSTSPLPEGIVTPLVAFVDERGVPDTEATTALVDHQVRGGVAAVLVNGSMGELGNLTAPQRVVMVDTVVTAAARRIPVWAGVGALGTAEAIAGAVEAESAGADALLVLPPLYFVTSDAEVERHFGAIADAVSIPVLAYDLPQRAPRKLAPESIARMGRSGVLAGVKDSSGDMTLGRRVCLQTAEIAGFRCYAGTELAIDAAPALGFAGSVPGLANIFPDVAAAADAAAREGDRAAAARAQAVYADLLALLSIPLEGAGASTVAFNAFKAATAGVLGLPNPPTLAPMTPPTAEFLAAVASIVDRLRVATPA
jgi:4-hydroxy-tetrahydrodipicolinate synthase